MIVATDADFISVALSAQKIAEAAHTAYWLKHVESSIGLPQSAPGYSSQEGNVLAGFREIAARLGFRVEPIQKPTPINIPAE